MQNKEGQTAKNIAVTQEVPVTNDVLVKKPAAENEGLKVLLYTFLASE